MQWKDWNSITDKELTILISTGYESDAILDYNVDFVISHESNPETPQRAPIQNQKNEPVIETNIQSPYKVR